MKAGHRASPRPREAKADGAEAEAEAEAAVLHTPRARPTDTDTEERALTLTLRAEDNSERPKRDNIAREAHIHMQLAGAYQMNARNVHSNMYAPITCKQTSDDQQFQVQKRTNR